MTAAEAPPQDALRDVLAHRPAMLALATLTVGSLGAAAQATALGYRVFELTRRELDLGWLGLAEFLPSVLLVAVSGPIADRLDRRKVVAASFVGEILCAAALAVLARSGAGALPAIFAVVALFGAARSLGAPAARALIPDVVPPALLPRVVALQSATWQGARIVGPVIGGALAAWSPSAAYIFTAAAAGAAALMIGAVRVHTETGYRAATRADATETGTQRSGRTGSAVHEAFAGLREVRRLPVLLDEARRLDEHAAAATCGVEDLAAEGLDDLDDEPDDGVRGEELTAEPALGHGEVREEVLVDEPECVSGERPREWGEQTEQFGEGGLLKALVALRENISQLGVGGLHGPHGGVDRRTQVVPLRKAYGPYAMKLG